MGLVRDLVGLRFERLLVLRDSGKRCDQRGVLWECLCDCGTRKLVHARSLVTGMSRSCGCLQKERVSRPGSRNSSWKGGRFVKKKGYVRVLCHEHPYADSQGYVLEHRLVVEGVMGRFLRAEEVVHHINGVKGDNRPENLQLFANDGIHHEFHSLVSGARRLLSGKKRAMHRSQQKIETD